MPPPPPTTPTKQTIASEQKRLNGRTFALHMIRTPKPPPPSPKPPPLKPKIPSPSPNPTRSRKTGILSGLQEIRIHQLHQTAFALPGHKNENPLIAAIQETVVAQGVRGVEGLGRVEYEAVERRLEGFIRGRGGRVPRRV